MSRGGRLDDKSRPMSMPTRAAPLAPAALTRALTLARTPTSILTSATLTLAPAHPLSLTIYPPHSTLHTKLKKLLYVPPLPPPPTPTHPALATHKADKSRRK